MLIKAEAIKGFKLDSKNGEIGKAKEFYFDDKYWTIRYLVAETGSWLTGNQVLISPHSLKGIKVGKSAIDVDLTKEQIKDSPQIECDRPVSRQFEEQYNKYYGWPNYWVGPYAWGPYPYAGHIGAVLPKINTEEKEEKTATRTDYDSHLHSTDDVRKHSIQAKDGDIGRVYDFIVDDKSWEIRYLIIDTGNWLPGKKILISPKWIESISWDHAEVFVDLTKEKIENAPAFTDETLLSSDYVDKLHIYYGRKI